LVSGYSSEKYQLISIIPDQMPKQKLRFNPSINRQSIIPLNRHLHLGELGGCSTGDLGDAELGQLVLQVVQLLQQLLLLLAPQISSLDLCLRIKRQSVRKYSTFIRQPK
jgi:hypothetical protein